MRVLEEEEEITSVPHHEFQVAQTSALLGKGTAASASAGRLQRVHSERGQGKERGCSHD